MRSGRMVEWLRVQASPASLRCVFERDLLTIALYSCIGLTQEDTSRHNEKLLTGT